MGHGIWPTKVKHFYTSKGAVQSETFTEELTSAVLDDELADFRRDCISSKYAQAVLNNPFYTNFRSNLLSLPKLVKQSGILFLVPPLTQGSLVGGYNAMNRSFFSFDFAGGGKASVDLSTPDRVFGSDYFYADSGIGNGRKASYRFMGTAQNLFKNSDIGNTTPWSITSGVTVDSPNVYGTSYLATIPAGCTTTENIYNTSYNTVVGELYTLSIWIKEGGLTSTIFSTDAGHFQFVADGESKLAYGDIDVSNSAYCSKLKVRRVSQYLEDAGYIYSVSFRAKTTSNNIGLHRFAGNTNDKSITVVAMQLEKGLDSHDYIRTTSSSVITAADQLSLDMNALGFDEWTIYMDFSYQRTNDNQPCYILSTNSTAAGSYLYSDSPNTMSTHMGFHGGKMTLTTFPQNTRQRVTLQYSTTRDPRGPYCIIRREGRDSEDETWSSGSPDVYKIPFNNHLEFFTGPGFVSAELKAFVIFDRWVDLMEEDLNDI